MISLREELTFSAVTVVCLAVCSMAFSLWREWKKQFTWRHSRSSPKSPSYLECPAVIEMRQQQKEGKQNKKCGSEEAPKRRFFESFLWSQRSASLIPTKPCSSLGSSKSSSSSSLLGDNKKSCSSSSRMCTQLCNSKQNASPSCSCCSKGSPSSNQLLRGASRAKHLHMDHVYMGFLQFFWINLLVYPSLVLLAVTGLANLAIRRFLHCHFGLQTRPHDPAEIVAKIVLETSQVIHYQQFLEDDNQNNNKKKLAEFVWNNIAIFSPQGEFDTVQCLRIVVDVKAKRVVEAQLDGEAVTAQECLTLITWISFVDIHPRVHAMANWGVNLEEEQQQANPQLAFESAVTVVYNYFGFVGFARGASLYKRFGALTISAGFAERFTACLEHSLKKSVPAHPFVTDLMPYSNLVRFVCHVRPFFLRQFAQHKECCFPGCDGEALFIGTALHGIDHGKFPTILQDPLWLDSDHPRFGAMAEVCRLVLCAFVEDLPFLPFHKSFRTSKHPLYQAVYQKAVGINAELANHMDTCIVK